MRMTKNPNVRKRLNSKIVNKKNLEIVVKNFTKQKVKITFSVYFN